MFWVWVVLIRFPEIEPLTRAWFSSLSISPHRFVNDRSVRRSSVEKRPEGRSR